MNCRPASSRDRWILPTLLLCGWLLSVLGSVASAEDNTLPADGQQQVFRGRVVRLSEALDHRKIRAAEEMRSHMVLETPSGQLIPILADWRGRAFYQDDRLRDRDVELVGFRRPEIPYLQVLMIFTFDDDGARQYTDYWCDVCAIPMYEIKPCECCQGDIRLRFQPRGLPAYLQDRTPSDAAGRPPGTD